MATVEMNERLTRVGPGTPCGELMRRYWIPIAPAAQLEADPVRKVRVLGEDLVLFRAESGRLGLIGDRCLHRAVDLQYGMPDGDGLRCPYHGWLYGVDGRCLETPLEDPSNDFRTRLQLPAYPVQELGGLIFAYLGPAPAPLLPPWDLFVWPNAVRQIGIATLECNWLQCHENTGDPTHSVYLHGHFFKYVLRRMGVLEERAGSDVHTLYPRIRGGIGIKELYARPTRYGMEKGVVFSQELGAERDQVRRHSTVVFPFYTQTGSGGMPRSEYQIRVPMDDTHTYHICYQAYAAPPGVEAPHQDRVPYYDVPLTDDNGKPILDYVLAQDILAWRAQGTITDRTREHLGRTDLPIVFLRRQLEEQIRIVEHGGAPMNVFRDPAAIGAMLHGSGEDPDAAPAAAGSQPFDFRGPSPATFRAQYHKGFVLDDADRYGPAVPLVQELHRRIEERMTAGETVQLSGARGGEEAVRVDEQIVVPLGLDAAWDFVWQVDRLAACMPGCTGAQVVEPGRRYTAQVAERIGPYKVEADLDVVVQDAQPQKSIHATISGRDRRLGTTQRVDLTVELRPLSPSETSIDIGADVEVLGKVASLGQFAIKRKVKDIVAKFGQNVRAACQTQQVPSPTRGEGQGGG